MQLLSATFVLSIIHGTTNLNTTELQFISRHLSKSECHQLIASLESKSFDLPTPITKTIPRNIPCMTLLEIWDKETPGDKTQELEHRLRQLGKDSLANWLGSTMFHELAKDINDTLFHRSSASVEMFSNFKLHKDKETGTFEGWCAFDSILWVWVVVLILCAIYFCCCYMVSSERKSKKGPFEEQEMVTLLQSDYHE